MNESRITPAHDVPEWHLYMIRTNSGALYTGIATDVDRRLREHQDGGARSARYLRGNGPLALAYQVSLGSRALALRAEARLKRLPKPAKERVVAAAPGGAQLLALLGLASSTTVAGPAHADA